MKKSRIDPMVFWPALLVIIAISLSLILNPQKGATILNDMFTSITNNFGWLYLWFTMGVFAFLLWLVIGRYGRIKLGQPKDKPDFSTASWVAMIFAAGIGTGILYWGSIEWVFHYINPPFGVTPYSAKAAEWAPTYGLFHWGLSAWAIYAVATVPIAYSYFVRRDSNLRISTCCSGILGKHTQGLLGKIIDILFIFGVIGGVGTALGLGTPLISAAVFKMFGVKPSFGLDVVIIILWTILFSTSVFLGLEKGIKVLSNVNIYLAMGLLLFVFLAGPTVFILKTFTNSFGMMIQNFIQMSFWTDPINKSGFPENWTIFYWAWWVSYAPFMGLFITKISKGRTIRELIINVCGWGSLGCWAVYAVLGNYSLYLQIHNILPITKLVQDIGPENTIIKVIASLPAGMVIVALFTILGFIFLATTVDSSAYTLALVATKDLDFDSEPERWHRIFWALVLAVVAISLLYLGGLKVLQTSALVVALPLLFIMIMMMFSLVKWLKEDFPQNHNEVKARNDF